MKRTKQRISNLTMVLGPPKGEVLEAPVELEMDLLRDEAAKCCRRLGLKQNLLETILRSDSDWAFILRIDALLEAAAKHLLRKGLRITLLNVSNDPETIDDFVDSLPMNGRTSILKLLEGTGIPAWHLALIESTRLVRNSYAHNIKHSDRKLLDLIKSRPDRTRILKGLSAIEPFNEAELLADYEADPFFLRSNIFHTTSEFLLFTHNLTLNSKNARRPRRVKRSR